MSETKFTPGPWKVVPREVMEDGSVYPTHIVGGVTELEICLLEGSLAAKLRIEKPDLFPPSARQSANFNLIAAAPDLYAFATTQLAEMDFRADPAEHEKRAELFALLQRARGEA